MAQNTMLLRVVKGRLPSADPQPRCSLPSPLRSPTPDPMLWYLVQRVIFFMRIGAKKMYIFLCPLF